MQSGSRRWCCPGGEAVTKSKRAPPRPAQAWPAFALALGPGTELLLFGRAGLGARPGATASVCDLIKQIQRKSLRRGDRVTTTCKSCFTSATTSSCLHGGRWSTRSKEVVARSTSLSAHHCI